jgi:hypothetical protein
MRRMPFSQRSRSVFLKFIQVCAISSVNMRNISASTAIDAHSDFTVFNGPSPITAAIRMASFSRSSSGITQIAALGHQVRLMSPRYVKPYVKRNKNDMADAATPPELREGANVYLSELAKTKPGLKRFWNENGYAYVEPFHSYADQLFSAAIPAPN